MRHFFGGTSRSFITLELRTFIHWIRGIGVDVRRRLAMQLLNLADRFGTANPHRISIALNLSHELLAGVVGASRQHVTEPE
jgi:hypothetical protein